MRRTNQEVSELYREAKIVGVMSTKDELDATYGKNAKNNNGTNSWWKNEERTAMEKGKERSRKGYKDVKDNKMKKCSEMESWTWSVKYIKLDTADD